MNKFSVTLISIALIYWLVTLIVPPMIDDSFNAVLENGPYSVSAEAQTIYDNLDFVGDLHCDALLWGRDLSKRNDRGQVDIPRMQEGNVVMQAFTLVTKSPRGQNMLENTGETDNLTSLFMVQGRPFRSWFSLYERAIVQCEALHQYADDSDGVFRVVHNKAEFSELLEARKKDPLIV
ncbi:MAG: hypothetical protein QF371_07950, partial [Flavobacteriales bacterium]|nr:hypothetical protein [Flavobacteriales bacterium]